MVLMGQPSVARLVSRNLRFQRKAELRTKRYDYLHPWVYQSRGNDNISKILGSVVLLSIEGDGERDED